MPKVHRYTNPPRPGCTRVCRALLLPQRGSCQSCSASGQIPGTTYSAPQTRSLRGKSVKFCNSRCSQYYTERIYTSPVQARVWEGGGRVAQCCLPGCGRTAVKGWHVPRHHPPRQGHQAGWLLAGIQGKKPSVRGTRLSLCCCSGLWITNIYRRAMEAVLQALSLRQSFL